MGLVQIQFWFQPSFNTDARVNYHIVYLDWRVYKQKLIDSGFYNNSRPSDSID